MVMQPASAKASAWTGDGPTMPALSRVIELLSLVPESTSSPVHSRSTTVGGFATTGLYARMGRCSCGVYRTAEPRATGAAGRGKIGLLVTADLIAIHANGRTTSR